MATNAKDKRLPAGLIGLLIYQGLAVVSAVGMGCIVARMTFQVKTGLPDMLFGLLMVAVLFGWGATMGVVSEGMTRRSSRAFLVGIVCHVLLEITALIFMFSFLVLWWVTGWNEHGTWVWDPFFLIFAGMWSPFVLISAWAIFYLRKLRRSLLPVQNDRRGVD
jgi:hypothetical protein